MTENNVEALVRVGPPTASAKKQARKEQRALAAAALAARDAEHVSAGWPQSWTPEQVGRWTEAGGDLTGEQRFEVLGWDSSEILGPQRLNKPMTHNHSSASVTIWLADRQGDGPT